MNLSCVRTKCTDCGVEAYRSAGVAARALGRPLTDHTAALIPKAIGCLECGSEQVDVFYAHENKVIVEAGSAPRCRVCDNYIPEPFLAQFPTADFCPLCVAADTGCVEERMAPTPHLCIDGLMPLRRTRALREGSSECRHRYRSPLDLICGPHSASTIKRSATLLGAKPLSLAAICTGRKWFIAPPACL